MSSQSLVYSNARVKAMENTLLSSEKITRMSYAVSLAESVKILYESNYGGGIILDNPFRFDEILKAEENKIVDFMREAMPKNSGLETFLTPLDYHNAKAVYKSKLIKNTDFNIILAPDGNIDSEIIKECILSDNLNKLPAYMLSAVNELNRMLITEGNLSPRIIDIMIDRAMYSDILSQLKKCKSSSIKKYWVSNIDLSNISTLFRCKALNANADFLKETLIDGGNIGDYLLLPLLEENYDVIEEKLLYTDYGKLVSIAVSEAKNGSPLIRYEAEWDNYLLDIFKSDKNDIFSLAPIAGFYIAKKIEIKMVRMILVCLKNKTDISHIKARLRGFYYA